MIKFLKRLFKSKSKSKTKEEIWTGFFVKDGIVYFLKKGNKFFMPIQRLKNEIIKKI